MIRSLLLAAFICPSGVDASRREGASAARMGMTDVELGSKQAVSPIDVCKKVKHKHCSTIIEVFIKKKKKYVSSDSNYVCIRSYKTDTHGTKTRTCVPKFLKEIEEPEGVLPKTISNR